MNQSFGSLPPFSAPQHGQSLDELVDHLGDVRLLKRKELALQQISMIDESKGATLAKGPLLVVLAAETRNILAILLPTDGAVRQLEGITGFKAELIVTSEWFKKLLRNHLSDQMVTDNAPSYRAISGLEFGERKSDINKHVTVFIKPQQDGDATIAIYNFLLATPQEVQMVSQMKQPVILERVVNVKGYGNDMITKASGLYWNSLLLTKDTNYAMQSIKYQLAADGGGRKMAFVYFLKPEKGRLLIRLIGILPFDEANYDITTMVTEGPGNSVDNNISPVDLMENRLVPFIAQEEFYCLRGFIDDQGKQIYIDDKGWDAYEQSFEAFFTVLLQGKAMVPWP